MGRRPTLITAIFGGYDRPTPNRHGGILVSDTPVEAPGWDNLVAPLPGLSPRLAAKVVKCRPDWFVDIDRTLWVDGCTTVTDDFVRLAGQMLDQDPIVTWAHPWRNCAFDEAAECARLFDGPFHAQAAHYRDRGLPERWGLWETTFLARRHTEQVAEFGRAWLAECERWTARDQISLPYIAWTHSLRPATFGSDWRQSGLVSWWGHSRPRQGA